MLTYRELFSSEYFVSKLKQQTQHSSCLRVVSDQRKIISCWVFFYNFLWLKVIALNKLLAFILKESATVSILYQTACLLTPCPLPTCCFLFSITAETENGCRKYWNTKPKKLRNIRRQPFAILCKIFSTS